MTKQDDILIQSAVKSQHQTIMEGGKIEEFAEALGRFCQVEGWKKLKDEDAESFKSLRHYIEARPPFGAGYPGREGMEKIEAYLSLKPKVKDYFQYCHANCIFEMAKEEGVSANVISKREWNDVIGAKLARDISEDGESGNVYKDKAMAYIEGKARVKREAKFNPNASIRLSFKPSYPYALAGKLLESFSRSEKKLFIKALSHEKINELVEFERRFHLALNAFEKSKQEDGWGIHHIKSPIEFLDRKPEIEHSQYEGNDNKNKILLKDEIGSIAIIKISSEGRGINGITFD